MDDYIEDMAKLICRMPKKCDDCWQYECQAKDFAKILYDAYYRKIPKDGVVLTREGHDTLISIESERIKQARQEIVEKFAERVSELLSNVDCGEREYFALLNAVDKIAKDIIGEVK